MLYEVITIFEGVVGPDEIFHVTLFAGPQEQSALKQVAPGLDLVVDYGWLTVIAAPIFCLGLREP